MVEEYNRSFLHPNYEFYTGAYRSESSRNATIDWSGVFGVTNITSKCRKIGSWKKALLESKKTRIIAGGGGRKPKLSLKEQIILTLVYLRHMTTFQLLGIQLGVSESTANDTFNYWLPLLGELLPSSLVEQVKKKNLTMK